MAGESVFGDSSLFDEFDRESQPSDKILKQKLLHNNSFTEISPFKSDLLVSPQVTSESEDSRDEPVTSKIEQDVMVDGDCDVVKFLKTAETSTSELKSVPLDQCLKLQKQVDKLSKENTLLKKRFKMINSTGVDGEWPAMQVIFMNHKMSRKYKAEVEGFIEHLMQNDDPNEALPYLHLRPTSVSLTETIEEITSQKDRIVDLENNTAIGCGKFYRHFIFDNMGWPLIEYNPSLTDGWCVPRYFQTFLEALPIDDEVECDQDKPKKLNKVKATCFNCGGDHNLRECPNQRDDRKIHKARQEFNKDMSALSTMKKQRYIPNAQQTDIEKFKAGQISDNLKHALNINDKQLPPFIYQMRVLGYPPGWLQEAEVFSSGVLMFDKHGKALSGYDDGITSEDGEIENKEKKYDFTKLISYPGFNVEPELGCVDECEKLGMPEMNESQKKERMEFQLTPVTRPGSGKKRSIIASDECPSDKKKPKMLDLSEMDLVASEDDGDSQLEKKSIANLEDEKKNIKAQLAAMKDGDESINVGEGSFIPPLPPTPDKPDLPLDTPPVTPIMSNGKSSQKPFESKCSDVVLSDNEPENATLNDSSLIILDSYTSKDDSTLDHSTPKCNDGLSFHSVNSSGSLQSAFGTPVLEDKKLSRDIGKGLPEPSKFAAGISEHIPFENLPESTGKFNHMKKVLSSMRTQKSQSEET